MSSFLFDIVDLTHTLNDKIPTWNGSCGFEKCLVHPHDPDAKFSFLIYDYQSKAGAGTHIDAPLHCNSTGMAVHELPLDRLIGRPAVVLNIVDKAHELYSLSVQDIQNFEIQHGQIATGSFVFVHTGWDQFWTTPDQYRNNLRFPSVSIDAAQVLFDKGVIGIGIDTLSPDREEDGFPVHKLFLEADLCLIENATNLNALPPMGSFINIGVMKIEGGTEAPVRLTGLIPKTML